MHSGIPVDLIKVRKPYELNSSKKLVTYLEKQVGVAPNKERLDLRSFSTKSALDGELYPKHKLSMLVKYLEKRDVYVYGTGGASRFVGRKKWCPTNIFSLKSNSTTS